MKHTHPSVGADHSQNQKELIRTLHEIIDNQEQIMQLQNEKIGILIAYIDMLYHHMEQGVKPSPSPFS